uniref:Copia protein n=1 Tax=Tanacetum cinerariifolium TaxID=118510 RepID=A0A6L2N894_TANCI|nr:copia protein [Tanacetum cinerariifolium]
MTFEEVEAKFNLFWKQMEDFIPMSSKEEVERINRKGLNLEQESAKKQKTLEKVPEEAMSPEEVPEEKVKKMMQLVPIEEVYVEALQVKHHIIDWKGRFKSSMEIVEWKLYDTCEVHHVTSKNKEIFMLVEKDYPLRKGLALVMISYKLQVENYSQMQNDLILKIYKIENSLRQQGRIVGNKIHKAFPLPVIRVPTGRTNSHCNGYATAPTPQLGYAPNQFTDLSSVFSSMSLKQPPEDPQQYIDTGASSHMSYNSGNITNLLPSDKSILVGNGAVIPVQLLDFNTDAFIQRCNSRGDLYSVVLSPSFQSQSSPATALSFKTDIESFQCDNGRQSSDHRGSRCLDLITQRVHISRHVTFDEDHFSYSSFHSTPSTSEYDVFGYEDTPLITPGHVPLTPFVGPHETPSDASSCQAMTLRRTAMAESCLVIINPLWLKVILNNLDFDETFSPVVKPVTIQTVLNIAISRHWPIHQLDVKHAFLNEDLIEEVYMKQPPGYVDPARPTHVCHLRKALYGLKQAPRAWYHNFTVFIASTGFVSSKSDNSLFTYYRGCDTIYLLLYVDDIILTASSAGLVHRIISRLSTEFAMTGLGEFSYFLGIAASSSQHVVSRSSAAKAEYIEVLPMLLLKQLGCQLAMRHSVNHSSSDSSSRHSFSDHSSPDLPSTSARPSRKRRRSPMTSVPALPPVSGALSPVRADLIPSPKRVRDIGYLADVEVGPRETRVERVTHPAMPEDIPEPTQEGVVQVTYETLIDLVQRFHDHTQAIPVYRIQVIEGVQREQGHRIVRVESAVTTLTKRVAELERYNRRLRGTVSVESQRVDRL